MAQEAKNTPIRLRATLRRHGLVRRPQALRRFVHARGLRFTDGNRLVVFDNGADGLAAMLSAIQNARLRIDLETYILRTDATGMAFVEAMADKARQGVTVRLLYDAFGSHSLDPTRLDILRQAGGDIVAFNPLRRFYPRWLPRRRDHRKLLVVDGAVAFLGGLNIGDEYNAGTAQRPGWRDTHVRVEGPAVRDLEAVFLESWFRADGPDLPWAYLLGAHPEPCGAVRCAVVPDGPVYRRRMARDLLVMGLWTARREARLTTPYFAPDRRVFQALVAAASRQIRVDLLLAGTTDHPILRRAAHSLLPRLLRAGVRIWEYEGATLHAKTAVFDERWAIIGTSNFDRQSFQHNYEVNLIAEHGDIPLLLNSTFEHDITRAVRIDETSLAARSLKDRVLDRLSAFVLHAI